MATEEAGIMQRSNNDTQNSLAPPFGIVSDRSHSANIDKAVLEEQVLEMVKGDAFLVDWYGPSDAGNPQNIPVVRKAFVSSSLALFALSTTFASSVFSAASVTMASEFDVTPDSMIFGCTSLFMIGFAIGPIVFGPLSEAFGRRKPLLGGYLAFALLQLPVIDARRPLVIYTLRFLQGFFGTAPSSILMGVLADMWTPKLRALTMPCVGSFLAIGPCLGPWIANVLLRTELGWRGIEYVTAISSFTIAIVTFPFIPETYSPILLIKRAKHLRVVTQNWALRAKAEETPLQLSDLTERYLMRPVRMLILEPILCLMTLYISVSFGLLYNFFLAYPASFAGERGWDPISASLPLLALMTGIVLAGAVCSLSVDTKLSPDPLKGRSQETRLLLMLIGAISLPAGMLSFALTSTAPNPWPQILSGIPTGFGLHVINMQGMNYIADCYGVYTNSAIAANTFLRSLFAAGFPYMASKLYAAAGVKVGTIVLAGLAAMLAPIPLVLFCFGAKIRVRSAWKPPVGL